MVTLIYFFNISTIWVLFSFNKNKPREASTFFFVIVSDKRAVQQIVFMSVYECPSLRGTHEGSASVWLVRIGDVAQTQLQLLQGPDAYTAVGLTRGCLFLTKTIMEGHVCNIQVLLRAAEFLERRERGESIVDNCHPVGEEVGYC